MAPYFLRVVLTCLTCLPTLKPRLSALQVRRQRAARHDRLAAAGQHAPRAVHLRDAVRAVHLQLLRQRPRQPRARHQRLHRGAAPPARRHAAHRAAALAAQRAQQARAAEDVVALVQQRARLVCNGLQAQRAAELLAGRARVDQRAAAVRGGGRRHQRGRGGGARRRGGRGARALAVRFVARRSPRLRTCAASLAARRCRLLRRRRRRRRARAPSRATV